LDRQFVLATAAAFVTSFVLSFLFHGVVLGPQYNELLAVYRGPQLPAGLFGLLLLAQLIRAAAMVAIYRKGREDKAFLGQGVRFGLLAAAIGVIPAYLIGYAVTNIPAILAIEQIVLETVIVVAMGIVIAWFHR
jgi:hypothetical protein